MAARPLIRLSVKEPRLRRSPAVRRWLAGVEREPDRVLPRTTLELAQDDLSTFGTARLQLDGARASHVPATAPARPWAWLDGVTHPAPRSLRPMTPSSKKPTASVRAVAARLAASCVLKSSVDTPMARVQVSTERIVATDGRQLVVIGAPDSEGLFAQGEQVGLVQASALLDALRGKVERLVVAPDFVSAHHTPELGSERVVRTVVCEKPTGQPFEYPNWSEIDLGSDRKVTARVGTALLGRALLACSRAGMATATLRFGKPSEAIRIDGELSEDQGSVLMLVMPIAQDEKGVIAAELTPPEAPAKEPVEPGQKRLPKPAPSGRRAGKGRTKPTKIVRR